MFSLTLIRSTNINAIGICRVFDWQSSNTVLVFQSINNIISMHKTFLLRNENTRFFLVKHIILFFFIDIKHIGTLYARFEKGRKPFDKINNR